MTPQELKTLASVPYEAERWSHSAKLRLDEVLYHELQARLYSQAVCGKMSANVRKDALTETLCVRLVQEGFKVTLGRNYKTTFYKVSFE